MLSLVRVIALRPSPTHSATPTSQVRHSWLLAHEVALWCEPTKRPPTAAKTRGQFFDRDCGAAAAAARDGRARDGPTQKKRVRFSDDVAIIGTSDYTSDRDDEED